MEPLYNTIQDFLEALIGTYTPVTYSFEGNTVIASGFAGVDWSYLCSFVAFALVLYSLFRLIGVIFQCK